MEIMDLALDLTGQEYISPTKLIRRGKCDFCHDIVLAKTGNIKAWHWAHFPNSDCPQATSGSISGEMTFWHKFWQSYAAPEYQEVRFSVKKEKGYRVADVFNPHTNRVIEIQHSPLSIDGYWWKKKALENITWILDFRDKVINGIAKIAGSNIYISQHSCKFPLLSMHNNDDIFIDHGEGLLRVVGINVSKSGIYKVNGLHNSFCGFMNDYFMGIRDSYVNKSHYLLIANDKTLYKNNLSEYERNQKYKGLWTFKNICTAENDKNSICGLETDCYCAFCGWAICPNHSGDYIHKCKTGRNAEQEMK